LFVCFDEEKMKVGVREKPSEVLVIEEGLESNERGAKLTREMFAAASVSVEVDNATCPTAEFGIPAT
jgi:hypothetical protein